MNTKNINSRLLYPAVDYNINKLFIILVVLYGCTSISCNSSPNTPSCSTTNTEFQQIENAAQASGMQLSNQIFCDEKRIYFTSNTARTICKIGFKGNDSAFINNLQYRITILDNTGTSIYTATQRMNPVGEYHSLTTPINIVANQAYVVRVSLALPPTSSYFNKFEFYQNNGNLINYPLTVNGVSIVSSTITGGSNCSSIGGDYELPKIDVVFQ